MTKLERLKDIKSLTELALLLGFKPKMLSYILYVMPNTEKYYESFSIPKKSGGMRTINAPNEKLKLVQKRLANLLYDCYDEIIKSKDGKTRLSHGFSRRCSIFTNSLKHCKKRYVFNIDLKDFFPSINFGRVRGYFINDKYFKLNENIATIIAKIACFNNELPQGSPVSPIISNLIGNILDARIIKLSKEEKCFYSRYADDLTFSTTNKQFPNSIAFKKDNHWIIGEKLKRVIENAGFNINQSKISMQYKSSRQTCVGLIVNKKVNVKKEYYKNVRAMCDNLLKNNKFFISKDDENNSIFQLEGMINFIYSIKRKYDKQGMKTRNNKPNAITNLYRKFLFFKYFINIDKPVIFTEGKSDIIYLKYALRKMMDNYPSLIEKKEGKHCFNIKFFKSSKLFRDVFAIAEGTSGLNNLMNYYKTNFKYFKLPKLYKPIIFLFDNDEGTEEIRKLLKIENKELKDMYEHFFMQIYALFVGKGKNTRIEDLFDKKTLNIEIDSKKFEPDDKKKDNDKNYGKHIFSRKVILPNYEKINFENFKPIFDSILEIMSKSNENLIDNI